jgi:formylglycine-generating enzyme required for sulfatase activity
MASPRTQHFPLSRGLTVVVSMLALLLASCRDAGPAPGLEPIPGTVAIAGGTYPVGSTPESRESALTHAGIAQSEAARRLLDRELSSTLSATPGFLAGIFPVTMAEYAKFVAATGHPAPSLGRDAWYTMARGSGLGLAEEGTFEGYVLALNWVDGKPPAEKLHAPVVMVSLDDAKAYCGWLSGHINRSVRLPDEVESEIIGGAETYPWGDAWQFGRCHASPGLRSPISVGSTSGTPLMHDGFMTVWDTTKAGIRDYAGQVYEWTSSPAGGVRGEYVLKGGGSILDGPVECRRSARRMVPKDTKHPLVGFRIVIDPN